MEWKTSVGPVPYEVAIAFMEERVRAIREGKADELVWLLEHPALFTAGTSAKDADLVDTLGFPVYKTGRGGQYTYHGPGQRVAYVMLDLKKHGADVRKYVKKLEGWIIATLAALGVAGFTREGRVGVWVTARNAKGKSSPLIEESRAGAPRRTREAIGSGSGDDLGSPTTNNTTEAKIAALGVRIRQWVSFHGISLNVNPDLSHYRGIVPCGIKEYGVTSLAELEIHATMRQVDDMLMQSFGEVFGAAHA